MFHIEQTVWVYVFQDILPKQPGFLDTLAESFILPDRCKRAFLPFHGTSQVCQPPPSKD